MSCKTETKEIGDNEFSVTQWPATKAMMMKLRLVKAFGSSIAVIASGMGEGSTDQEEAKALSDGLVNLFNGSSPDEIVGLIKDCVVGVACNGKRITDPSFDELFSGDDLLEVYKVFIFVVKVNYSNLMKGQLVEGLLTKIQGTK